MNLHQQLSRTLFCFHVLTHITFLQNSSHNVTVEKNFFQGGNQSFQYDHHYHGQKKGDPLSCVEHVLMCFYLSFRAFLSRLLILFLILL